MNQKNFQSQINFIVVVIFGVFLFSGCSKTYYSAMEKMGKAMSGGKKIEPVDYRELKTLLPDDLDNMIRENARGEKSSAFGIKVSEAHANYHSRDGEGNISISITDLGSISGLTSMATMAWTYAEFERDTDNGYEKTTKYKDHKAFESYDNESESGEISVLIANRFVVEVDGEHVNVDALKDAVSAVDLDELEDMKNEGVED